MRLFSQKPLDRIFRPFEVFAKVEASGGILLLLGTIVALVWVNSPWSDPYTKFWHTQLGVGVGGVIFTKPLVFWVNDGLMAIFFFVVGLEIKREVLVGELASVKKAALPLVAALGGMVIPASIYMIFNAGTASASGWGIPMATDIAFALGVLALLGKRVPLSLKVFLTALAIVDDLGAVLVIALFYTAQISVISLGIAALLLLFLVVVNRVGVRGPLIYVVLGLGLWLAFLESGIHPTIAGVLLAMTIPARASTDTDQFLAKCRGLLGEFERAGHSREDESITEEHQAALQALKTATVHVQTPMERLEYTLLPWISFGVMPVFALANAGVVLKVESWSVLTHPVVLGVALGLVIGKQLGITLSVWLAIKSGLVVLPLDLTLRHIYGASWLAGIGFTMSLFIADLAFDDSSLLTMAKLGILTGSLIAGAVGWWILRGTGRRIAAPNRGE